MEMPHVTAEEFLAKLQTDFHCIFRESTQWFGFFSDGYDDPMIFVERDTPEGRICHAFPKFEDGKVTPTVARSICARLGVDPRAFGIDPD
jgi:hypothetical protein